MERERERLPGSQRTDKKGKRREDEEKKIGGDIKRSGEGEEVAVDGEEKDKRRGRKEEKRERQHG